MKCCDKEAKWIDMGPNLSYWFCESCRKEVEEKTPEELGTKWPAHWVNVNYLTIQAPLYIPQDQVDLAVFDLIGVIDTFEFNADTFYIINEWATLYGNAHTRGHYDV